MTPSQIHALRKRLSLSADAFAERLGLAGENRAITVYRWESGDRTPSPQTVFMLKMLNEGMAKRSRQRNPRTIVDELRNR
jgi:DNA-binding transcriptional regulator YiaG